MQMTGRLVAATGALCAIAVGGSIAAPSAAAWSRVPAPHYSMTNANQCEHMSNGPGMTTLRYKLRPASGPSSYPELRVRISGQPYGSAPSVCAYVADYRPGRHHMELVLNRDGWKTRAIDSATYENYAGALHVKGPGSSRGWRFAVFGRVVYGGKVYERRVSGHSDANGASGWTAPDGCRPVMPVC